MHYLFVFMLFALQASITSAEDTRLPPPDEESQKQAVTLVRDVFKAEYSKSGITEKLALAAKLLQQATDTRDDPAARYVLYKEAEELAAQCGDATIVLRALEHRSEQYKVDAIAETERLLDIAVRAPGAKRILPPSAADICKRLIQRSPPIILTRQCGWLPKRMPPRAMPRKFPYLHWLKRGLKKRENSRPSFRRFAHP